MRASATTLSAIAAGATLLLSSCGGASEAAPPLVIAVANLCLARSEAVTDPGAVRATFYDRSHDALHTIARDLEPVDRSLAARLLEAKEAVESDVNARPPASTLAGDLDHLIDTADQGLTRLSMSPRACPR